MHDVEIQPETINQLAYGVFPSFAMLAAMQLKLFTALSPDGASHDGLSAKLAAPPRRLLPLVDLLVSTGLLVRQGDYLRNSAEAEAFLVEGRPEYRGGMAGFYEKLWTAALQTAQSIQTGGPTAKLDFAGNSQEELMVFFRRQFPSSLLAGQELAHYTDLTRYTHLADLGGGTGGASVALCNSLPNLRCTVYELPSVVTVTRTFITEAGLSERIAVEPTDLGRERRHDQQRQGQHDLALLRSVLQVMDEASARAALGAAHALLRPGGTLLIVGSVLHDDRKGPAPALARGLVFLNVYESGSSYTESQHRTWLSEAGFHDVRVDYSCMRDGTSVVQAVRP